MLPSGLGKVYNSLLLSKSQKLRRQLLLHFSGCNTGCGLSQCSLLRFSWLQPRLCARGMAMDQRFCQLVFMRAYLHRIYKLDLASKVVGDWADMGTSRFMSQSTDSKHCKVAARNHADSSAQPSEAADTSSFSLIFAPWPGREQGLLSLELEREPGVLLRLRVRGLFFLQNSRAFPS